MTCILATCDVEGRFQQLCVLEKGSRLNLRAYLFATYKQAEGNEKYESFLRLEARTCT